MNFFKNTNGIGISIINIHYDIASVMFATETATETDVITPHTVPQFHTLVNQNGISHRGSASKGQTSKNITGHPYIL